MGTKLLLSMLHASLLVSLCYSFMPTKAVDTGRRVTLSNPKSPWTTTMQMKDGSPQDDAPDDKISNDTKFDFNPLQIVQSAWDSFATASIYRTLLFTAALSGSKSLRELIGAPGFFLIFIGSLAYNTYETTFDYLVDIVTPKRQAAVQAVRQAKTEKLTGRSQDEDFSQPNLETLLSNYEEALREELQTRVIVPNILVIRMDETQEDRALAQQWLGLEITEDYRLVPVNRAKGRQRANS